MKNRDRQKEGNMNGADLLKFLQSLSPEELKLPVICRYWQPAPDPDSSGWEEEKGVDCASVGARFTSTGNQSGNAICLE